MKKAALLFIMIIMALGMGYAQCNSFYNYKEGTSFTFENYDKKDRLIARSVNKVVNISGGVDDLRMTIHSTHYDKKDDEIFDGEFTMICEDGVMKFDFRQMMPAELSNMENAKIEFSGDNLELPSQLTVGQQLPNAMYTMQMVVDGVPAGMGTSNDIQVRDREVEKKELIKVPAGSFDSYKVNQTTVITMNIMGIKKQTESSSSFWYSPQVGMVRSESYDKKGRLDSYTVLTEFER